MAQLVPSANELPPELEKLSRRNAIELSDNRWDSDVREFIKLLEKALLQEPRTQNWRPIATAAILAIVTTAAVWLTWPVVKLLTEPNVAANEKPSLAVTPTVPEQPAPQPPATPPRLRRRCRRNLTPPPAPEGVPLSPPAALAGKPELKKISALDLVAPKTGALLDNNRLDHVEFRLEQG